MCRTSIIHEACEAGARDGRTFVLTNDLEFVCEIFSRQFPNESARDAYKCNFLAEAGNRLSPANELGKRFVCA